MPFKNRDISKLAQMRTRAKLTQVDLGKRVFQRLGRKTRGQYAQKMVSLWECGVSSPSEEQLLALADVLGVTVEDVRAALPPGKLAPKHPDRPVTAEDLKFLLTVQEGLSKPLTIRLVLDLLSRRNPSPNKL